MMTHSTICYIKHPIKSNKKLYPWSKWLMDSNQMEHLVKSDKQKKNP